MALTTAPITLTTTARPSVLSSAATGAGILDANSPTSALSTRAGVHDTATSTARPPARRVAPTVGTTRPWATRSTAVNATRPSHRTLGPTPFSAAAPTVTSHPKAS